MCEYPSSSCTVKHARRGACHAVMRRVVGPYGDALGHVAANLFLC
jgi:hypothetical protein